MSASGDGPQNNQNGQQVNPHRFANGDQEPANEPVNGGFLNDLYLALHDICWFLHELIASVLAQYNNYLYGDGDDDDNDNDDYDDDDDDDYDDDDYDDGDYDDGDYDDDDYDDGDYDDGDYDDGDYDDGDYDDDDYDDDDDDNNVNVQNINVRDNNANADNNEQHEHHNALVVVGIENEEAFEDRVDANQYIPEEDPQPGVSRRRSREMDEEDLRPNKRMRWSDDDSELFEDAHEELDHETGGSRKRSREDFEEEEEYLPVCKLQRCSTE